MPQDIIGNLLAALIGQSDPEKYKNPNVNDDPNAPLYVQPSFGTKLMHPEVVNYINSANANWANEPLLAKRQRSLADLATVNANETKYKVAGSNVDAVRDDMNANKNPLDTSITGPNAARMLDLFPIVTQANQQAVNARQNIPTLSASNKAQSLKEDTASSVARTVLGLPLSNAETAISSNAYNNRLRSANTPNIELSAANDRARMAYEEAVRPGQLKVTQTSNDVLVNKNQRELNGATALDEITNNEYEAQKASSATEVALANTRRDALAKLKTALNNSIDASVTDSARSRGLSEQNLENLDADKATLGNTSLLRAFSSRYDAPIPPFATRINDDGNVSVGNTGFDSSAIANMQSLSSSLGKKPVQIKDKTNGKIYAMPIATPEYDPVSGKRVINTQNPPGKPSVTEASANPVDDEFAQNLSKVEPKKKALVIRQVASELVKALNIPTESKALQIGSSKYYDDPALVIYEALVNGESHGFKGADIVKQFNALPDNTRRAIYNKALSSVTSTAQKPIGSRPLN